jgi:hypothetical protein
MKMSAALTIRVVTSLEEFKGLAREWEELLDRVPGHSLFLTWEWLYYWATHHLEDGQLRILLASDEHECLVGIAPLYLRRTKAQGLISVRELRWLGSEAVCSSYLDVIVHERAQAGPASDASTATCSMRHGASGTSSPSPRSLPSPPRSICGTSYSPRQGRSERWCV